MIPKGLSHVHFLRAATEVERRGVPRSRAARHYDLLLNGKKYPPKYIISLANRFAHGSVFPAGSFNAVEAKDYLLRHGYKVIDRRKRVKEVVVPQDDESTFPEGAERFAIHRFLERDNGITKKAKKQRLAEIGKLECDVCGFNFERQYGEKGRGFIEAHHLMPVATLGGKSKTRIGDIGLVCSNCHRMLHRGPTLLSVEQLRRVVNG